MAGISNHPQMVDMVIVYGGVYPIILNKGSLAHKRTRMTSQYSHKSSITSISSECKQYWWYIYYNNIYILIYHIGSRPCFKLPNLTKNVSDRTELHCWPRLQAHRRGPAITCFWGTGSLPVSLHPLVVLHGATCRQGMEWLWKTVKIVLDWIILTHINQPLLRNISHI